MHEEASLSYAQLNAQANRLARHLRTLGVGPDARVALCVERGLPMMVGLLAVLKAGGAYVPLDPSYPSERLRYMLEDSAPVAVLTQAGLGEAWQALTAQLSVPVLNLGAEVSAWANLPDTNLSREGLTVSHLAYVIYTSGSTGLPKGAGVEHQGLSNLMHWYVGELNLADDDALLVITSYSFDLTQKNLFGPLLSGGSVLLPRERFDVEEIAALIGSRRVAALNCTPSMFHALMDHSAPVGGLRHVVLGGEPIQASKLIELDAPELQFINGYGPTECSAVVAFHRLRSDLAAYQRSVPLGRPIPNARLYVLDGHGEPVPVGVAGEIHIGGVPVGAHRSRLLCGYDLAKSLTQIFTSVCLHGLAAFVLRTWFAAR